VKPELVTGAEGSRGFVIS